MSKTKMHQELISRAKSRPEAGADCPQPPTPVSKPENTEALDRKKIVQEILKKNESLSPTRELNEQRRRDFFAMENTRATDPPAENEAVPEPEIAKVSTEEAECAVERPPRQREKIKSDAKETKNEENQKKTCVLS